MPARPAQVIDLPVERLPEAVELFALAFENDPLMLHLFGGQPRPVRDLVAEMYRYELGCVPAFGWSVKAVLHGDRLAGAVVIAPPESVTEDPGEYAEAYGEFAASIGPDVAQRLTEFLEEASRRRPAEPHFYICDLAVHPDFQGQGYSRQLLDAAHRWAETHPTALGVGLDTENRKNVTLYEHFGYRVVEYYVVAGVETWSLFRPNPK